MKRFAGAMLGLVLGGMAAVTLAAVPDIPARTPDGKTRNVNEFIGHGKWTVVVAWAHDCQICAREIHEMGVIYRIAGRHAGQDPWLFLDLRAARRRVGRKYHAADKGAGDCW